MNERAPWFPARGCTCLTYGHGMLLTIVVSPKCAVHGAKQ